MAAKKLKEQGKLLEPIQSRTLSATPSPMSSGKVSPAPSNLSETEADGGAIGRETRRRLVEWWSKEYCASRMRLAIVGKGQFLCFATSI